MTCRDCGLLTSAFCALQNCLAWMSADVLITTEQGSYCCRAHAFNDGHSRSDMKPSTRDTASQYCQDIDHKCARCNKTPDCARCDQCGGVFDVAICEHGIILCERCAENRPEIAETYFEICDCGCFREDILKTWTKTRLDVAAVPNDSCIASLDPRIASLVNDCQFPRGVADLIESFIGVLAQTPETYKSIFSRESSRWRRRGNYMARPLFDVQNVSECIVSSVDRSLGPTYIKRKDGTALSLNDICGYFGRCPVGSSWVKFHGQAMIQVQI